MSTMTDAKRKRSRRSFTDEFKANAVRLVDCNSAGARHQSFGGLANRSAQRWALGDVEGY